MFIQDQITQNYRLFIGNDTIEMVKIAGGKYQMGRNKSNPIISISDFWIGKFPVSQALYEVVTGHNPAHFKDKNKPVEQVNWQDSKKFIAQLNDYEEVKKQKLFFRLPTEVEWEYAASDMGNSLFEYAGSDDLGTVGWYDENSPNQSQIIGMKTPNKLGIYDLTGNVWEWCEDDYDDEAYQKTEKEMSNPVCIEGMVTSLNPALLYTQERLISATNKVNRGGSWRDGVRCCRLENRDTYAANLRLDIIGFRLVSVFI